MLTRVMPPLPAAEVPIEELRALRELSRSVDDLLEESLKARESLELSFRRLFPPLCRLTGARAVVVTTQNEELAEGTWHHGEFKGFPGKLLADHPWGARLIDGDTLVSQALDVAGTKVGAIGLMFAGDQLPQSSRLVRLLETVAEELDTVLSAVHTAAEKHHLIVSVAQCLSNRVFEVGMDQAVQTLAERVRLPGFLLLYRDAVSSSTLHYRVYRHGRLEHESGVRPFASLEAAIHSHGGELINVPGNPALKAALGEQKVVETVLISGATDSRPLGKLLVWSPGEGFSTFTMEVLRLLAATLAQRLVDYNRERIHLSQFFSSQVIDELLQDPRYEGRYLSPRDEQVGILFADINGFTRICELVLEKPEKIGQFVDDWSREVVDILWKHGGVFDKMVGDCVIGLFGPPFFKSSQLERAEAVTRAAIEIQQFTRDRMTGHPEVSRISEKVQLPGLGVAIGVNLAPTFCGLFGPNKQYTGFSTGMNQTARLQALGAFRETLVMAPVRAALEGTSDAALKKLEWGPLTETAVKNVANPLRHFRLL
jgi:adenylate cyclase